MFQPSSSHVEQVSQFQCTGADWGLFVATLEITGIAASLNFNLEEWDEPGIGKQHGFNVRLSNGIVVHAQQGVLDTEPGVGFYADSEDIQQFGSDVLIDLCIRDLKLPPDQISWRQSIAKS